MRVDLPGLVTWIISHRRMGEKVTVLCHYYPQLPPPPSSTHSLRFWSAVCRRLLPLKRRWQPLIITQAERRAFLSHSSLDRYVHTHMQRPPGRHWSSPSLTNESNVVVIWGRPFTIQPGRASPPGGADMTRMYRADNLQTQTHTRSTIIVSSC